MDISSVSVLACEDDDSNMIVLEEILKIVGIKKIFSFENPVLARKCLADNRIDLIITDNNMPEMTGLEFVDWLDCSPYKKIPVLMLSALIDNEIIEKAQQLDFVYLEKPYAFEGLKDTVLRLLNN